jgi:hypothetical protein
MGQIVSKNNNELVIKNSIQNLDLLLSSFKCPKCKSDCKLEKNILNENSIDNHNGIGNDYEDQSDVSSFNYLIFKCKKCSYSVILLKCHTCQSHNIFKSDRIKTNFPFTCKSCKNLNTFYICSKEDCNETKISALTQGTQGNQLTCYNLKCKTRFTQIDCKFCSRVCSFIKVSKQKPVFSQDFNEDIFIKKYIPGQTILCPYEDCKNTFSMKHCNKCLISIYSKSNKNKIGEPYLCITCKETNLNIFCVDCQRKILFSENNLYSFGNLLKCPYSSCGTSFYLMKCSKCDRFNYFSKNLYRPLQPFKCGYSDCENNVLISGNNSYTLCEFCGFCQIINGTKYGKEYKCTNCKKPQVYTACTCGDIRILNQENKFDNLQVVKCNSCLKLYYNRYCLHCEGLLFLDSKKYKLGMTIECPYDNCKKLFNTLPCVNCGFLIEYKDPQDYFEGMSMNCAKCSYWSNIVSCALCTKPMLFTNLRDKYPRMMFKEILCFCDEKFYVTGIHKKIYKALPIIFSQPGKIIFTHPEKLDKFISINDVN